MSNWFLFGRLYISYSNLPSMNLTPNILNCNFENDAISFSVIDLHGVYFW